MRRGNGGSWGEEVGNSQIMPDFVGHVRLYANIAEE